MKVSATTRACDSFFTHVAETTSGESEIECNSVATGGGGTGVGLEVDSGFGHERLGGELILPVFSGVGVGVSLSTTQAEMNNETSTANSGMILFTRCSLSSA